MYYILYITFNCIFSQYQTHLVEHLTLNSNSTDNYITIQCRRTIRYRSHINNCISESHSRFTQLCSQ